MRIITISREFGSGGRELGKRLADNLGWDYYDREIISRIAQDAGLDADYVDRVLSQNPVDTMPLTFMHSFAIPLAGGMPLTQLLVKEKQVIERIALKGRDAVIVGRNADVYLQEYAPLTLFVCASMDARIRRCRERADENEHMSDRELKHSIRRIDSARASLRELVGGAKWGDRTSYMLTVNTTDIPVKGLSALVAQWATTWFEARDAAAGR